MAGSTSTSFVVVVVLLVVSMVGVAARPVDAAAAAVVPSVTAKKYAMAPGGDDGSGMDEAAELNGMMKCMVGCFTQVMACTFGCMGKGPDLPLCVISCNQKSIVCMIRCSFAPSPPPGPKPSPPTPTPTPPAPAPKPSPPTPAPKPPKPSPSPPKPPGPPYAGHNAETTD